MVTTIAMDRKRLLYLFISIAILSMLISYLNNEVVLNREFFYSLYQDKIAFEQLNDLVAAKEKWQWVGYAIIPLILIIKVFIITFSLWLGLFVKGNNYKMRSLYEITLKAEVVNLMLPLCFLIWFGIVHSDPAVDELKNFHPLSLAGALGVNDAESWIKYPLTALNVFELIYVLVLAYILSRNVEAEWATYGGALKLVVVSYGSLFILWVLIITFFFVTIQM